MDPAEVEQMVLQGMTHKQISVTLQQRFPATQGLSERSVRRYCGTNDIHKLGEVDLDEVVEEAVGEVSSYIHDLTLLRSAMYILRIII